MTVYILLNSSKDNIERNQFVISSRNFFPIKPIGMNHCFVRKKSAKNFRWVPEMTAIKLCMKNLTSPSKL